METLPEVVGVHPAEGGRHHGHGLLHRQLRVLVLPDDGVEKGLQHYYYSTLVDKSTLVINEFYLKFGWGCKEQQNICL